MEIIIFIVSQEERDEQLYWKMSVEAMLSKRKTLLSFAEHLLLIHSYTMYQGCWLKPPMTTKRVLYCHGRFLSLLARKKRTLFSGKTTHLKDNLPWRQRGFFIVMGDSSLFQRCSKERETNLVFQEDGIRSPSRDPTIDLSSFSEVEIKDREPRGKGRVFRLIIGNKNQVFMWKS